MLSCGAQHLQAPLKHALPTHLKEDFSDQGKCCVSHESLEPQNHGTAPSKSEVAQTVSVYSGRLRATPQRLDPCQPANQLSVPRASFSTSSDGSPTLESLDTQEKSCTTHNTDVYLSVETAKCVASSLRKADGSSPRTPAVVSGTRCNVPTRSDCVHPKPDSVEDNVTAVKMTHCPKCKLGRGRCRYRNKPGHLVDPSIGQESVPEKQSSQAKVDERAQHLDQNKIETADEESEPALTQELPAEALAKPVITKRNRHLKSTESTMSSPVSTTRMTRSSVAKILQNGQSKIDSQHRNSVDQKNEPHSREKAIKLFPSGGALNHNRPTFISRPLRPKCNVCAGAIVAWTKSELGVLNDAIAAQRVQNVEVGQFAPTRLNLQLQPVMLKEFACVCNQTGRVSVQPSDALQTPATRAYLQTLLLPIFMISSCRRECWLPAETIKSVESPSQAY
eukprot:COSAG02_NODE_2153_length_9654_cov_6.361905_3_plen_449_part_00